MGLQITFTGTKSDKMVAFATVVVNEVQRVGGIKIWKNEDGYNVAMPGNSRYPDFKYVNKKHQEDFEQAIMVAALADKKLGLKSIDAQKTAEEQKNLEPAF